MPVVVLHAPPRGRAEYLRFLGIAAVKHGGEEEADPGEQPADGQQSVTGASDKAVAQADWEWWGFGILLIVVGVWIGRAVHNPAEMVATSTTPTPAVNAGFSEFALFYILTQSLERFSEFVSYIPWVGIRIGGRRKAASTVGMIDKEDANKTRELAPVRGVEALAGDDLATAKIKATEAANAELDAGVIQSNRAVFFFAFNTMIAAICVGYFEILLLKIAGIGDVRSWMDITITALAIGGGTKPLHDLIKNIQKNKDQPAAAPTTRLI